MFDVFRKYLTDKITLSDPELTRISSVSIIKKLRRRQYLLQEGDIWKHYAFVSKGCLRIYRLDEAGNEHILKFCVENWWAGDRESLLSGNPSRCFIDALEESVVIMITKENFDNLCKEIPAFNQLVNDLLNRTYIASQERIHANITYTSEEKYLNFTEKYPDITARVPLHMIASYLGISPETLSRIRSQNARKNK
ncbi:MAG: Crp/Fnr family transcriptional regulator [Pseudosphingobacterium sp.]|uniref:Crp/Fnr family transcriptional regulator n=1 Tax=Olivibacter sp. 47 TaxID=3056486 RepID=UPI0025A33538|nr:Crp/Fnr family transcriptional regulator [Olivibacter sp. 47]MDM8176904.1 Crp/Fnr family transcriptional regulator [Olivibacter sp. 47]MDX3912978.1 Crp/Fnr family transcriptional regulator [Pseudosphingobacterium sp.]